MVKEISALKAWEMLNSELNSTLIDVRTEEEWRSVGKPFIEKKVFYITSHTKPDMSFNPQFLSRLELEVVNKKNPVIFICRGAARSKIAADFAKNNGYETVYFVADGYEGSEYGPGWKLSNLPCK